MRLSCLFSALLNGSGACLYGQTESELLMAFCFCVEAEFAVTIKHVRRRGRTAAACNLDGGGYMGPRRELKMTKRRGGSTKPHRRLH